jgi:pre-mRNA-splicing factor 38A
VVSGGGEMHRLQLIDRIVRDRIFANRYWKEECFGLNAETLVDKAIELNHIGGTCSSTGKPTPFLCLVAKLLQINPELDIVTEFINNRDYKYVNALALFFIRLVGKPKDIYTILEMFYNDYRKLRIRNQVRLTALHFFKGRQIHHHVHG